MSQLLPSSCHFMLQRISFLFCGSNSSQLPSRIFYPPNPPLYLVLCKHGLLASSSHPRNTHNNCRLLRLSARDPRAHFPPKTVHSRSGNIGPVTTGHPYFIYLPTFLTFVASSLTTSNEGGYFLFLLHMYGLLLRATKIKRCPVFPCVTSA